MTSISHPQTPTPVPASVNNLEDLTKYGITDVVAAIGVFDGIHLGHRKIISELISMSKRLHAAPVVITFYPHPRQILRHEKNIHFLLTQEEKAAILGKLGVKAVVTIPFTVEFASQPPEQFIKAITTAKGVRLRGICVGRYWKFGAGGSGGKTLLEKMAAEGHFEFTAVDEVKLDGAKISSSAIRKAFASGDNAMAEKMLGARAKKTK